MGSLLAVAGVHCDLCELPRRHTGHFPPRNAIPNYNGNLCPPEALCQTWATAVDRWYLQVGQPAGLPKRMLELFAGCALSGARGLACQFAAWQAPCLQAQERESDGSHFKNLGHLRHFLAPPRQSYSKGRVTQLLRVPGKMARHLAPWLRFLLAN